MNPITHLLVSWNLADRLPLDGRDRSLVTWCGVIPDADGAGILADFACKVAGQPGSDFYTLYHHSILHGLPAAIAVPGLLCLFGIRRLHVFVFGIILFHLHLLCDLVGSRGGPEDVWPIPYLAPFSQKMTLSWQRQWLLDGWQNILITAVLLSLTFYSAATRGRSPVALFSNKADTLLVAAVKKRIAR